MQTTETMNPAEMFDEPTVTVRGQQYTAADARDLSLVLRLAADRVELADTGALEVLASCAEIARLGLADLAREAGIDKVDPDTWTKYDARRVAVEIGSRIGRA